MRASWYRPRPGRARAVRNYTRSACQCARIQRDTHCSERETGSLPGARVGVIITNQRTLAATLTVSIESIGPASGHCSSCYADVHGATLEFNYKKDQRHTPLCVLRTRRTKHGRHSECTICEHTARQLATPSAAGGGPIWISSHSPSPPAQGGGSGGQDGGGSLALWRSESWPIGCI